MFYCVLDLWSCCFKDDFYGVLGDLGNPLRIWNSGYCESSPCTTKDCSIYGSSIPPTSIDVIDGYEHWAITGFLRAQVNYDSTIFENVGVDWIARVTFVIIFIFKNIYILFAKQSENKAAICLARFLFHNQVVVDSLGVCPAGFYLLQVCKITFFVKKNKKQNKHLVPSHFKSGLGPNQTCLLGQ